MRTHTSSIPCLFLLACTPETDLRQVQTALPTAETTSDGPASPPSEAAPDPLAGQLVEPPNGATGIPTNLALLVVRFSEPVQPVGAQVPFVLRPASGGELPLALGAAVPCAQSCYALVPEAELAPTSLHTLESVAGALQFLDGKPVPSGAAGTFATAAAADGFAPRISAFSAEITAGCLAVHLAADEPVRVEVTVSAGDQTVALPTLDLSSTLDFAQPLRELAPGAIAQAVARVVDRGGNAAESPPVSLLLPPAVPQVVITEVLANPAGSETTQEFVEIHNAGNEAVGLGGLVIADKSGSDVLPEAILVPGAFALVVAENYDPADGNDVAPREGTLLLPVPGRIGSDGLSNSGEAVRLLTSAGGVISQYGGFIDVGASAWSGKSVKRSDAQACDAASAWSASPSAATPGW
ncbi:MAG: lamin tail domain-containing protein [Deltaproteobacteria bacterium]|nr:lamin tail domain-containing protein [Deltaproteobacteria bacterium]